MLGNRTGSWGGRAWIVSGVLALAALPAFGQDGPRRGPGGPGGPMGGMFGGMDMPAPMSKREFGGYTDALKLTAEQRDAAKTLFEGYQAALRSNDNAMQNARDDMRDSFRDGDRDAAFQKMRESTDKVRAERAKIEQGFMSDMQALLTPDQARVWPKVERSHRRAQSIGRGRLAGESVDLVQIVDEMKLGEQDRRGLDPAIESYESDLDKAMQRRDAVYDELRTKIGEAFRNRDMDAAQKLMEQGREEGVKVRDLNRRYAKTLSESLPDERRGAFASAVQKASFPRIYRETQASKELKAAGGLSDLSAEQKQSVAALQESYTRNLGAVNGKLEKAQDEAEMTFRMGGRGPFGGGARRGGDGGPDGPRGPDPQGDDQSPLAQLRRERQDLDKNAADSLRKILSKEQAERLPRADPGEDGFRRRGNRGQGGPPDDEGI